MTEAAEGRSFSVDTPTALSYALKHLELNLIHYGAHGFFPFKKQLPQYIRSINNASEWRGKLLRTSTVEEMRTMLEQIVAENTTSQ